MSKIRVGIVGSAGYAGGELIRLLLAHPNATVVFLQSRSQAGKKISTVHTDLFHSDWSFLTEVGDQELKSIDVLFLAMAHGESRHFLTQKSLPANLKVVDLGQDFRLKNSNHLGDRSFVYGLPELNRNLIKSANSVANPGCFATALQLGLLPLAAQNALTEASVTGITGSTGAGQGLSATSHFSFRESNIQAYKTLTHQHLSEVNESVLQLQQRGAEIAFVPWRGDFTRGIFVSAVVKSMLSLQEAQAHYQAFYDSHPFVRLNDSNQNAIDLKSVVNTNYAWLELHQAGSKLVIHAAIDNLLKGASGQAVQNMNLMFDLPETTGLNLKAVAF